MPDIIKIGYHFHIRFLSQNRMQLFMILSVGLHYITQSHVCNILIYLTLLLRAIREILKPELSVLLCRSPGIFSSSGYGVQSVDARDTVILRNLHTSRCPSHVKIRHEFTRLKISSPV